jgi:glutamate-1-semialdehyde 2,1-aminomutase
VSITPAAMRVLRKLSRHFATHGIVLPGGAAACVPTPMVTSEIQLIIDVFANFISTQTGSLPIRSDFPAAMPGASEALHAVP